MTKVVDPSQDENSDRQITIIITQASARADHGILSHASFELSRSQLKRLFELGKITIEKRKIKASSKLSAGTQVQINVPTPKALDLSAEALALDILYEDRDLLVVNKPTGLTVHPSPTQKTGTLVHALLHHIKDLSGIGGVLRPGIVHRIDKNTSGALLVVKNDDAHRKLAHDFSTHSVDREYWTLVYGRPKDQGSNRIESLIGRNPIDRKKMSMRVKLGRKAITHFQVVEDYRNQHGLSFASFLRVQLETGRTHQVRVHLQGIGHSVLGDPIYGAPTSKSQKWLNIPQEMRVPIQKLPGQALHARILGFKHPRSGQYLRFEAPLPIHFEALLQSLQTWKASEV